MNESQIPVIIIGAGIAGLTAAWYLQKMGIKTLVLEVNKTVGGRMQSVQIDDALIDYGAQFFSSAYTIIPNLIKETNLVNEFIETSAQVGLIGNKGITLIQPKKPWQLFTKHVLSIWSFLNLALNQFKLFKRRKKSISLNDITYWIQYDNQLANDWIIQNFGEEVACELTATIFNGFYFQSLKNSSAALAAAVVAFSAYNPKTMTLKSGMGSLPQKMADKLNIKTNVSVSEIIETSFGVKIISDSGEFSAENAIVT